jgi:hypothetical protein
MERIRRSDGDVGYVDEEICTGLMSRGKAARIFLKTGLTVHNLKRKDTNKN